MLFTKTINKGAKWSANIGKGKLMKFTALEEGANISLLIYNSRDLTERYNMPDTLKEQHTSHLTKGNVLVSDNGRVLASIVEDTLGWHDTICGYITKEEVENKYGKTTYQELRNDWLRNGEENFAIELVRNGLGLRDLAPGVNLFSKVYCDENGTMNFSKEHCKKGDSITLRTEMDVLIILSNTPNPLDESKEYPSVPVKFQVSEAETVKEDDYCVNYRPENKRAFENTWEYYALL